MTHSHARNAPINIRAFFSERDLIDKAASVVHKNRSDFMLEAACREAENILLDQRLFFVDDKAYSAFMTLFEQPIQKNQSLQKCLRSKAPWE